MALILILAALLLGLPRNAPADAVARQEATLVRDYHGAYEPQFNAQFDRVRLLVRQAQLEVSSRLGLIQYTNGFQYPMTIHFEDSVPAGLESALAYVRLMRSNQGAFQQELVVNMAEMNSNPMDFDTVFYHEMTHAVMNDATGGEASAKIPHWVQEGLAVYVSGEGEARVKRSAQNLHKSQTASLVFPLGGLVYGAAYAQYYLAIRYLVDKHSVNAVQGLVRDLIAGKSVEESILDCTGLSWADYQRNVRDFSAAIFRDLAIPDNVISFGSKS
jgi:hypothetical protein